MNTKRHLLDIQSLSTGEIEEILERAEYWKTSGENHQPFSDCFVANLFYEPSTRTRFSFEIAEKKLGVQILSFDKNTSSVTKGETLWDTLQTLAALGVEVAVIRHPESGIIHSLAKHSPAVSLINAGDGIHAHPTQALLDLFTLKEHFRALTGLTVAVIGDLRHSRVARSSVAALKKCGVTVLLSSPEEMRASDLEEGASFVPIDEAVSQADAVMMLRVQLERHTNSLVTGKEEYHQRYGLTMERLSQMKPQAVILHPGPVNRNVEIASNLVEHPRSLIGKQVENGVYIRMAVLERVMRQRRKRG